MGIYQGKSTDILGSCDDLRIVYQPSDTVSTELARAVTLASGATNCTDSSSTIVSFPLQASIGNGSSNANYYVYYSNHGAPAYSSATALSAYNIGAKSATFVAPFNGNTTALAAGTGVPTAASGADCKSTKESAVRSQKTPNEKLETLKL